MNLIVNYCNFNWLKGLFDNKTGQIEILNEFNCY